MKIIFMGTADFSAEILEKLNSRFEISAVVTGCDKESGRGKAVVFSPVKKKALELGLKLLQFEKVSRDGIEEIKELSPDVVVTAAFGQILSDEFLAVPKFGTLNVHASLLPKYRGSSPIQTAIINGEDETGVTIMRTVKEVDAGDVLLSKKISIEKMTAGELFDKLSILGGEAICEALELVESGKAVFTPQDASKATFCKQFTKNDGIIDFSKTAAQLDCFIRGVTPWPAAFSFIDGTMIKVFNVSIVDG
ncbi:MAG: methionyl-tRNA formyltransferase, partial [Christensenellales bacterium]